MRKISKVPRKYKTRELCLRREEDSVSSLTVDQGDVEEMEKTESSTELVSKKQISSVLLVCETELGTPGPKLLNTSKDQNEEGRGKEVKVFEGSSKDGMEGIEDIQEILDLSNAANLMSKLFMASDTQSSSAAELQAAMWSNNCICKEARTKASSKVLVMSNKASPKVLVMSNKASPKVLVMSNKASPKVLVMSNKASSKGTGDV